MAVLLTGALGASPALAAQPDPGLGTAKSFAVLAGSTVTNTGPSLIAGNLGVFPGTAITGFPPGLVVNGVQNSANALAAGAKADLAAAWVDAAGRGPATTVTADIGRRTLGPGVYSHPSAMFLTGTLTLDAKNNPAAVFIFQAGSSLITASGSRVNLINGAQPCNVYWQVGSSATLRTDTTFVGTMMALASVTLQTRTTVNGRILASTGQVSLDTNTIRLPTCDERVTSTGGGGSGSGGTTTGGTTGGTPGGGTTGGGPASGGTTGGTPSGGTTGGGDSNGGGSGGNTPVGNTPGGNTPGGKTPGGNTPGGDTPGENTPNGPRIPPGHPRTGSGGTS